MKKEPLSIMIVKTLLVVIIFAGIGTIIIGGGWLIGEQGVISLPHYQPSDKSECKTDSDCYLVYVGSDPCLPCDTLSEEYQCFNESERIKQLNNYKQSGNDFILVCSPCAVEFDNYVCKCVNGECKKVKDEKAKKELTEKIIITTDKMEYEHGENITFTVTNIGNKVILYLKKCSIKPYMIYDLQNNSWGNYIKDTFRKCSSGYSKFSYGSIGINRSVNFIWNQDGILPNLEMASLGKYKISLDFFKESEQVMRKYIIYSNEFTIKEKSAFDHLKVDCKKLDSKFCERDEDCICEGRGCFLGGKLYWENCVDKNIMCLDLCPQSCKCVSNKCNCTNIPHA